MGVALPVNENEDRHPSRWLEDESNEVNDDDNESDSYNDNEELGISVTINEFNKKFNNRYIIAFDVIVSPKRTKGFKWTADIEDAILEDLKEYIYVKNIIQRLLKFVCMMGKIHGKIFTSERSMLRLFVSKASSKFTVITENPQKLSQIGRSQKCVSITDLANQTILHYQCSRFSLVNKELRDEFYSCGTYKFCNIIEGPSQDHSNKRFTPILGMTEVNDKDFYKGIAQNDVQLESTLLNRKRKANETKEGPFVKLLQMRKDGMKEWCFKALDYQDLNY
ncbi:hypothetical protein GLOIN_2v1881079 [Rhizophagus clarus]|uniref:PiggyBac transposable element-derived protein domain-containing protein n=1 Tax=Rhizophagus clarus TaxID=94130 RepID=A0A8H3QAQ1_9GLOM|nr:hypothetical protein GLOIN_2v1881079 [Rhizophagus clarus]